MTDGTAETLRKALQLHRNGDRQAAYDLYQQVLKTQPDQPDALHLLGVLAFQSGNIEQGDALISRAIALRPGYREAELNLAGLRRNGIEARSETEISYQDAAPQTWSPDIVNTVDDWRHMRMLSFVASFTGRASASWLTVGDAYGNDAIRLKRIGLTNVTPSNLTTTSLEMNRSAGFIDRHLRINAEKIDLPDASFDFVLCKEAYHHMARPLLAVYEMLRVARDAVMLIEPQDPVIDTLTDRSNPHWYEVSGSEMLVGRHGEDRPIRKFSTDWREEVGNYVYTISRRELKKLAIGMQLPMLAFRNFNDHFDEKLAKLPATPPSSALDETVRQIEARNQLCQSKQLPYHYLVAILFKRTPDQGVRAGLQKAGFDLVPVPRPTPPIQWPNM